MSPRKIIIQHAQLGKPIPITPSNVAEDESEKFKPIRKKTNSKRKTSNEVEGDNLKLNSRNVKRGFCRMPTSTTSSPKCLSSKNVDEFESDTGYIKCTRINLGKPIPITPSNVAEDESEKFKPIRKKRNSKRKTSNEVEGDNLKLNSRNVKRGFCRMPTSTTSSPKCLSSKNVDEFESDTGYIKHTRKNLGKPIPITPSNVAEDESDKFKPIRKKRKSKRKASNKLNEVEAECLKLNRTNVKPCYNCRMPISTTSSPKCLSSKNFNDSESDTGYIKRTRKNSTRSQDQKVKTFSPIIKFHTAPNKIDNSTSDAISSKERNYLICKFQETSINYKNLKVLANEAINKQKLFLINGYHRAVRKALVARGWVEKIPRERLNLNKIRSGNYKCAISLHKLLQRLLLSNLVTKYDPNFIWLSCEKPCKYVLKSQNHVFMVNRLKVDATWTSKEGLCDITKENYWFYSKDVSEVFSPRTFTSCGSYSLQIDEFIHDYKITACTNLLKLIIMNKFISKPIFVESGKVSLKVIKFALNKCKEYVLYKQHADIDNDIRKTSSGQWHNFLNQYYSIIEERESFTADENNKLSFYLLSAKLLLKEMYKYRPDIKCEGYRNIWIVKPTRNCRGRGIHIASKLAELSTILTTKSNIYYVIQKYIEYPLLIYKTKFDIRQYYLVTGTNPLVIWMYQDCYLKFSSQLYSLNSFHESIHLTNNAIQKKYVNCKNRHPALPIENMWSLETYKDYLKSIGNEETWHSITYPGMKKAIVNVMLNCQNNLISSKNSFELYGCDFLIDKKYKPWLIEINSSPDVKHTTKVTSKICPEVLEDIIKVVIDRRNDIKAPTGKFECIYRQNNYVARYGAAADLVVQGHSLPSEYFCKENKIIEEHYKNPRDEQNLMEILRKIKNEFSNIERIMKQKSAMSGDGKKCIAATTSLTTIASCPILL